MVFGFNFLHRLLGDVHTPHYFNEVALVGNAADKPTGANAKDNMLFYEQDTGLWKRYRTALSEWVLVAPNMSLIGYDYEALISKNLAVDPETKALKIKSQIVGGGDGNGGVTTFLELTDVFPTSYSGQALKFARVKSGEDGLEFAAVNGGAFDNYKCRAYLGSNQIIPDREYTQINLSLTSYDPYGCFDAPTKSIIIKAVGDYLMCASLWFDYSLTDGTIVMLQVKKNGSIIMEKDEMCPTSGTKDVQPAGADIWPLALDDKITLHTKVWGGSGSYEIQATYIQNYLTVIRLR